MSRGQITNRGNNTWLVRIQGRASDGRRVTLFSKTVYGTKKDAHKVLTEALRAKDTGTLIEPNRSTLSEYLDKWLSESAKQKVRAQTYRSYVTRVNTVKAALGSQRLSDIKALDIQKFYNSLTAKGRSPRTVQYTHAVLSSALKQAVKWNILFSNPCNFCELPRRAKKERTCFTVDQAIRFLEFAKDSKHYALFFLAIETGLRPEEYLGLQWKDFDLERDKPRFNVQRAVIELPGGGFCFDEPKTAQSRRSVPISQGLADELKQHRRVQREESFRLGNIYRNLDLVFASEVGTPLQQKNIRDRHFKPLLKNAGLPNIRPYDMRHAMATLLLADGTNPKIVSERLGHASIVLTLDTYSHVLPTMQEDATARLEKMLTAGTAR